MKRIITTLASLAVTVVLVGACAAAAATQVPAPTPTPVPQAPTQAPVATTDSTPLIVTPMPTVTQAMPADLKAPAYATGTATVQLTKDVTRTKDGDCERVSGGVVLGHGTGSDARLSGTSTFEVNGVGCGVVGFEYGNMRIENAGGAWEGFCSGGIWANENASNLACWLTGSGAYEGLTAYFNGTSGGSAVTSVGVILPMPAPKQP